MAKSNLYGLYKSRNPINTATAAAMAMAACCGGFHAGGGLRGGIIETRTRAPFRRPGKKIGRTYTSPFASGLEKWACKPAVIWPCGLVAIGPSGFLDHHCHCFRAACHRREFHRSGPLLPLPLLYSLDSAINKARIN